MLWDDTVQQGEILAFLTTYFRPGFDSIQNSALSSKTSYDYVLRIVQDCDNVQSSGFAANYNVKNLRVLVSKMVHWHW